MDAYDLDRMERMRTGCIPPSLVTHLLERGHAREVELQAGRGEWFCAREWARLLDERGQRDEALKVLAPYVATGWWPAAQVQAELLESGERAAEAITLVRPYAAKGGQPLEFLARLLARNGHADEAVTRLSAGIDDPVLARALVGLSGEAGRDDEVAALLAARIPAEQQCADPWCCRGLGPEDAIGLLATIHERQGRVDKAIALLRTRQITSVNNRDQLADLLARHDRIDELRTYARTDGLGHGRRRLAELLEEREDVEGAIAVYQDTAGSFEQAHGDIELAQLLARHGRFDEAIDVMRALVDSSGAEDWTVGTLCTLYADRGHAQEGLAYLDSLDVRHDGTEPWEFFQSRLGLLAACGRFDEAIEQARAHPESDGLHAVWTISHLLAEHGRVEDAVAVLEPRADTYRHQLASHLIELGRIQEAVPLLQQPAVGPEPPQWNGALFQDPPF
ncbi:tetratricopeptide repeat protein [Streptomyces laurentii]|uniref:tetratricopeptide repeat protein n=1 Tax=Streptomyces laurentii TaxID=39478 RepID=UPI0034070FD6